MISEIWRSAIYRAICDRLTRLGHRRLRHRTLQPLALSPAPCTLHLAPDCSLTYEHLLICSQIPKPATSSRSTSTACGGCGRRWSTADTVTALAETFRALGDPTRVRILDALSHGELCVCDLAAVLSLSQSAVSHQLRLLRGLRLVRARRAGRMVFYALDDRHVIDCSARA